MSEATGPAVGRPHRRNLQYRRRIISKNLRCNEQIRISPIRLIDENDGQIGIVEVRDAMSRAQAAGLDLVEVSPMSKPPVCRIMDYGKWKYAQRKKEQKSKAHRHETELKEIRIKTPKIGEHDLGIKVSHAREFLDRGDRVQFSLRFRGRELAHIDEGQRIFRSIQEQLADVAKIEQHFRREGRRITMLLAPSGAPKKSETKPKGESKPAKPKPAPQDDALQAAQPGPAPEAAPAAADGGQGA